MSNLNAHFDFVDTMVRKTIVQTLFMVWLLLIIHIAYVKFYNSLFDHNVYQSQRTTDFDRSYTSQSCICYSV